MARSSIIHYLKWNFVFEVQYKSVWTPTLREKLNCREDDRKGGRLFEVGRLIE